MAQKSQIFEEGYGKGKLYKGREFIDFVFYLFQVSQAVPTTSLRSGKKADPGYKLSVNLKFANSTETVADGCFLFLVTKRRV
jgi:hypothetical protein